MQAVISIKNYCKIKGLSYENEISACFNRNILYFDKDDMFTINDEYRVIYEYVFDFEGEKVIKDIGYTQVGLDMLCSRL